MKNQTIRDILTREQKDRLQELVFKGKVPICEKHNMPLEINYYRIKRCYTCKYVYYIDKLILENESLTT